MLAGKYLAADTLGSRLLLAVLLAMTLWGWWRAPRLLGPAMILHKSTQKPWHPKDPMEPLAQCPESPARPWNIYADCFQKGLGITLFFMLIFMCFSGAFFNLREAFESISQKPLRGGAMGLYLISQIAFVAAMMQARWLQCLRALRALPISARRLTRLFVSCSVCTLGGVFLPPVLIVLGTGNLRTLGLLLPLAAGVLFFSLLTLCLVMRWKTLGLGTMIAFFGVTWIPILIFAGPRLHRGLNPAGVLSVEGLFVLVVLIVATALTIRWLERLIAGSSQAYHTPAPLAR